MVVKGQIITLNLTFDDNAFISFTNYTNTPPYYQIIQTINTGEVEVIVIEDFISVIEDTASLVNDTGMNVTINVLPVTIYTNTTVVNHQFSIFGLTDVVNTQIKIDCPCAS